MRFRFTLANLLWLTVLVAGIAEFIGAAVDGLHAGLPSEPHPIPEPILRRMLWQTGVSSMLIVVATIALRMRNKSDKF